MVANIKSQLGIHSPSDVLADEIGEFLPPGIGKGWDKGMPALHKHLAKSMLGLTHDLRVSIPNATGGGAPSSGVSTATSGTSVGNIIVTVDARGAKDPEAVGKAVSDSLMKKLRSLGVA